MSPAAKSTRRLASESSISVRFMITGVPSRKCSPIVRASLYVRGCRVVMRYESRSTDRSVGTLYITGPPLSARSPAPPALSPAARADRSERSGITATLDATALPRRSFWATTSAPGCAGSGSGRSAAACRAAGSPCSCSSAYSSSYSSYA